MDKSKLLVVDDEEDILELLTYHLTREGFKVTCAASGEEALQAVQSNTYSLILLDLMMPGIDGFEVTRRLKTDPSTRDVPIVMLTAKGEDTDIVAGLELGADDYIPKPFSVKVLISRIKAVLRRKPAAAPAEGEPRVALHDIVIDPKRQEVRVNGKRIILTLTEFAILNFLARRPGWVFTRSQIIDGIRGTDYAVTDRSVDVQIVGLRRKLGTAGKNIETVRGIGYRLRDTD
ncbi:MAG: response regulator transcription factor [Deltaproteobacteria bacterium]|nr:response regulator transcription factor [Deltaproteobacteria bacterium]